MLEMMASRTCFTTANNLNISAAVEFLKNQVCGLKVAEHRVERSNEGDSCADDFLGTSAFPGRKKKKGKREQRRK